MFISKPEYRHYWAISLLALSMMVVQILLTRVLSVIFFYHYAFAGIAITMLGLTGGALRVHTNPDIFTHKALNRECGRYSFLFALQLVVGIILLVEVPGQLVGYIGEFTFLDEGWQEKIENFCLFVGSIIGLAVLIQAYISAGVAITLLLTYFPSFVNKLYATDLLSAATGCLLAIIGLIFLDPISIIFLLAAMLSLLGSRLIYKEAVSRSLRLTIRVFSLLICTLFIFQSLSYLQGTPIVKLRVGKYEVFYDLLYERWNTFSHVVVFPTNQTLPFGWGFGGDFRGEEYAPVQQYAMRIDASAGTVLTHFDGHLDKLGYLMHDVVNFGYHLRDVGHAAVIGAGGGRDILSALSFDVDNITAIEINPDIIGALKYKFAGFTGNIAQNPKVNLVNAEARSFITANPASYDKITIPLIDTWAATVSGGLALAENKLYTVEAWQEFLDHLTTRGMLVVSRWFIPGAHEAEFHRMLSLAVEAIKRQNPQLNPQDHLLAVNGGGVVTLIVSKAPFTAEEVALAKKIAEKYQFKILLTPSHSFDHIAETIVSGVATKDFYDSLEFDVTPPTDDIPFFFNVMRLMDVLEQSLFAEASSPHNISNNEALYTLFALLILIIIGMLYAVAWPLFKLYHSRRENLSGTSPLIIYFVCIGLGFMLIEISMMQRLMIFLGHPVYGIGAILFTMLLFSGLGSYLVSSRSVTSFSYFVLPMLLCLLLVGTGASLPVIAEEYKYFSTFWRVIISVATLIPISIFMGMMFPLGVRAAEKNYSDLLPWFWALNGVSSVFASVAGVAISMGYGISSSYWAGVFYYFICLLLGGHLSKKGQEKVLSSLT